MVDPDKNNQDNAPVEDSDDTKTRKTVRLRPSVTPAGINLTPLPKAPLTDPLSGRDTDTGNLEVMEDTQTRRTVKLKPLRRRPPARRSNRRFRSSAGRRATAPNTQTRKTIVSSRLRFRLRASRSMVRQTRLRPTPKTPRPGKPCVYGRRRSPRPA